MRKGFTLIELIVVLAIIGVLVGILIAVLKPASMFARLRDSQRIADLNTLSKAIDMYITVFSQDTSKITMTASGTVVREASSTNNITLTGLLNGCIEGATPTIFYSAISAGSVTSQPISGAGGTFVAIRATSSKNVDGTGWIPVPLKDAAEVGLTTLPVDPRNSDTITSNPSLYYTYACKTDFSYELNAKLEINTTSASTDGGDNNILYEVGPNRNLLPTGTATLFYPY
jgi:prepilin-type N-terminal cleavage/methylation domain-containing protein